MLWQYVLSSSGTDAAHLHTPSKVTSWKYKSSDSQCHYRENLDTHEQWTIALVATSGLSV